MSVRTDIRRLWAEGADPHGAHLCFLLAGAAPQPFHPHSRVVLLGANHRAYPRTFATPAAIQRTELWEHGLRMAGSHSHAAAGAAAGVVAFPLLPAFKLVYSATLAEMGFAKEAVAYAEAAQKAARAAGGGGGGAGSAGVGGEVNAPLIGAIGASLEVRLIALPPSFPLYSVVLFSPLFRYCCAPAARTLP